MIDAMVSSSALGWFNVIATAFLGKPNLALTSYMVSIKSGGADTDTICGIGLGALSTTNALGISNQGSLVISNQGSLADELAAAADAASGLKGSLAAEFAAAVDAASGIHGESPRTSALWLEEGPEEGPAELMDEEEASRKCSGRFACTEFMLELVFAGVGGSAPSGPPNPTWFWFWMALDGSGWFSIASYNCINNTHNMHIHIYKYNYTKKKCMQPGALKRT